MADIYRGASGLRTPGWISASRAERADRLRTRQSYRAGLGTITGVAKVQTGPSTYTILGGCKVLICEHPSGSVVGVAFSNSAGVYSLPLVDPTREYYAAAFDPAGQYDMAATRSLQVVVP